MQINIQIQIQQRDTDADDLGPQTVDLGPRTSDLGPRTSDHFLSHSVSVSQFFTLSVSHCVSLSFVNVHLSVPVFSVS